ncbi:PfkB family carbohydrate kinase [Pseudohalioglobus lutimaris]|uniref:Carbohydrate kinase n=1 Tax=Pseudohalioglobus lutimaris TaxID=1737061 RepID=A0A2N5WZX6_9GAMM|nr:PfkB family carbohydrate kinase [Pseudohalioglobus lutimaris]PLW67756.1 carbohydrate kinase [Pseudohalioglobus lutimaris]
MSNVVKYNKKPTVHGTGLIALDIVISSNPDVPTRQYAGGTCGNVLTILSYLGWNSYPIARLNDEPSSIHAKNDLARWDVRENFLHMDPVAPIPVITQENSRDRDGNPKHRFHWKNCPKCGSWLPNYKAVTLPAVEEIKRSVKQTELFFFDRTSPAALAMAKYFKSIGGLVFFEPSAKGDPRHFKEAMALADIVKYSDQRFSEVIGESENQLRPIIEIQTLGEQGLRYRSRRMTKWAHLRAHNAIKVVDSCGCGDWTTAGIIHSLLGRKPQELSKLVKKDIEEALKYGQALGAWNCGFEGARGGMYQMDKKSFEQDVKVILKGGTYKPRLTSAADDSASASDGLCPACPAS